jgi:hypothetical protein
VSDPITIRRDEVHRLHDRHLRRIARKARKGLAIAPGDEDVRAVRACLSELEVLALAETVMHVSEADL